MTVQAHDVDELLARRKQLDDARQQRAALLEALCAERVPNGAIQAAIPSQQSQSPTMHGSATPNAKGS